jgi:hypothetical protein
MGTMWQAGKVKTMLPVMVWIWSVHPKGSHVEDLVSNAMCRGGALGMLGSETVT